MRVDVLIVPAAGGSVPVSATVEYGSVCRWATASGRALLARPFGTGFVRCDRSMLRVVSVAPNVSGAPSTARLGLQVWNTARTRVVRAAYFQLKVEGTAAAPPTSVAVTAGPVPTTAILSAPKSGDPTTTAPDAASTSATSILPPPKNVPVTSTTAPVPAPPTTVPVTSTTAPPPPTTIPPTPTPPAPLGGSVPLTSTNRWAGYYEIPGAVTDLSATWVVPALSCPSDMNTTSSTWVGVGGIAGGDLLQAGMYDNCVGGVQEHGAFAEEYPGSTASFVLFIRAGDTVTATVQQVAGGWDASVTDDTTGQEETGTAADYAGGTSAEWEVEDFGQPDYPLSDFGSESFTAVTVNGVAGVPTEAWEMVASNGAPIAVPSNPGAGVWRISYE